MVEGLCKKGYERVAEAFARNFESAGEVGASVCLTVGGETVVDLWGGSTDETGATPWAEDTLGEVFFECLDGYRAHQLHLLPSPAEAALPPEIRARTHAKSGSGYAVTIKMDPLGKVHVMASTNPQGQGHETVISQIVADELGVHPIDSSDATALRR